MPQGIITLESESFSDCLSLPVVPNSNYLEKIGRSAFKNCQSLQRINLPRVTNIEDYAFMKCILLENATFYPCLNLLGVNSFNLCPNMKKINLSLNFLTSAISSQDLNLMRNSECIIDFGFLNPDQIQIISDKYRNNARIFNYHYTIPEYEPNYVIFRIKLNPNERLSVEVIQEKIRSRDRNCHILDASGLEDMPHISELSGNSIDISGLIWSNELGHHIKEYIGQRGGLINELWDSRSWSVLFEGDETPSGDITLADLIFKIVRYPEILVGDNLIVYRDLEKPSRSKSEGNKPTPHIDDFAYLDEPVDHEEIRSRRNSLVGLIDIPNVKSRINIERHTSGGGAAANPRIFRGGGKINLYYKNRKLKKSKKKYRIRNSISKKKVIGKLKYIL